jgi:hypothetical protein
MSAIAFLWRSGEMKKYKFKDEMDTIQVENWEAFAHKLHLIPDAHFHDWKYSSVVEAQVIQYEQARFF